MISTDFAVDVVLAVVVVVVTLVVAAAVDLAAAAAAVVDNVDAVGDFEGDMIEVLDGTLHNHH